MSRRSQAVAVLYLTAVALLVLTPISGQLNALTVSLYVWWNYTLALPGDPSPATFEFALNVLMFVPLGLLVVLVVRWSWRRAVLCAVVLSAMIEGVQVLPLLHRTASWTDVVSNTLGGFLGAVLALAVRRRTRHRAAVE